MTRLGNSDLSGTVKDDANAYFDKSLEESRLIKKRGSHGESKPDKASEKKLIGIFQLFRFADMKDIVMVTMGALCAAVTGGLVPANVIIFAEVIDLFVQQGLFKSLLETVPDFLEAKNFSSHDAFVCGDKLLSYCGELFNYSNGRIDCNRLHVIDNVYDEMKEYSLKFCAIAFSVFVCGTVQVACFVISSQRQVIRLRQECFKNILRQEVAWFDDTTPGELTVRMTEDINLFHAAIGDALPQTIQWSCTAIAAVICSMSYGWELALIMLSVVPFMAIAMGIVGRFQSKLTLWERESYAQAGEQAEEVLSSVRTVVAFGGQEKEANRYKETLHGAKRLGIRRGVVNGIGLGLTFCCLYGGYALGLYFGGKMVRDGDYSVKDMMSVLYTTFLGAIGLGFALPTAAVITTGRAAAYKVYEILEKKSIIDSSSPEGVKPQSLSGDVEFKNVHFSYPSRPGVQILRGLDLKIPEGQTVALVGTSGCGKSTAVQLLLRYYDPNMGKICIDGQDIRDLNLKWLRQHVGLVSQEPILFATTIAENIRYGLDGVTMEEIIKACKQANAYNFIMKLPQKFETHVGERGAQLSGGQKQRIAIARALVRDPKLLLLDEATSALDTESEAVVQDALDKASRGRTTIVIAHRLSTIRHANLIVAFSGGRVVEQGTHDELIAKGGVYTHLVAAQMSKDEYQSDSDNIKEIMLENEKKLKKAELIKNDEVRGSELTTVTDTADKAQDEDNQKSTDFATIKRLFKLNSPEWYYILIGCLVSYCNGGVDPVWGIVLGDVTKVFADQDMDHQRSKMKTLSLISVALAVGSLVCRFLQELMFAISGESLTLRMRDIMFRAILRQNMAWFDDKQNSTPVLTTRLASEAPLVQQATGSTLGQILQCLGSLTLGLGFSMYFGWRLALPMIIFVPLLILSGLFQIRILKGFSAKTSKTVEKATSVAMEGVVHIRTVAALTKEDEFYASYASRLEEPRREVNRFSVKSGLIYGISQSFYYLSFALCFFVGGKLVEEDEIKFYNMFRVFTCVALSSMMMGRVLGQGPQTAESCTVAAKIFKLADVTPPIDEYAGPTLKPQQGSFETAIHFSNVHFYYPMRPEVSVLSGLDVSVRPGQTLALVGESGCGKSTTVQLLERFYDPITGAVKLDKYDIKDLNVQWLRSRIGLVSQEPVLFGRSIQENIAYGDNTREVSMGEIIQAARSANIHNFINGLPNGYDTNVGSKGTQLSGGQKQRIAIARALVRDPQILLLDEATSALDTESEKIVQEALDKARQGRTCITIAHRLSTIKDADKIAVLKGGIVHEAGTHAQLMASRGLYYQMQTAQSRKGS